MARELKSKYFSLGEFTFSQTAVRHGINNEPSQEHFNNLQSLVTNILDPLREILGRPIRISSGYRSPDLNKKVGGASTSQHCFGQAADIVVPGMTVDQVVKAIRDSKLPYDQLIHEFGSWTHVSYGGKNRRQALAATLVNGRTNYSALA